MAVVFDNLNIEMAGTEEEEAEGLATALNMEMEVVVGNVVDSKEGGDGNQ